VESSTSTPELELFVDGKEISIEFDFVREVVTNITAGAVGSLKGVNPDWMKLELRIRR